MSQHDYVIANDDGASIRADWNAALAAIKSNNSDASTFPASAVQGMAFTQTLSATQQLEWKYDGAAWRLIGIVDPTNGGFYHSKVRAISGLTLSNNGSDATNDIDIAAGWTAADGAEGTPLILLSALTGRLDGGTWVVGTNQPKLDTGSIANTTYHVWLIRRSDTGVVDVLFSTSASSPTMPANYDQKRRIGSIIRESAAIVAFTQTGDTFRRAPKIDRNSNSAVASALLALSIPVGIVVHPITRVVLQAGVSVTCTVFLGGAPEGSAASEVAAVQTGAGDTSDIINSFVPAFFASNTSAQIYFAQVNTAGSPAGSFLVTHGWIDRRGQDAA